MDDHGTARQVHSEEGNLTGTSGADWDVLIAPHSPWWKVNVKEIWQYRDLLRVLVQRDLTAIYKQTILGPIWQVLQPLLTSLMFAAIFGIMARMSIPGVPPLLFYLSGVVPWTFFANIINRTSTTLTGNAALMTKVYFPRLIPPMATTLSTAVSFGIQLVFFFAFALGYRLTGVYAWAPGSGLLMLPVLLLLMVVLAFGAGLMVAALTTKYRDLGFLIGFAIQLLMYMSPVIFPLSRIAPDSPVLPLILANPMTPMIEGFRAVLLGTPMDWTTLWYPATVTVGMILGGLALYQRVERSFADVV